VASVTGEQVMALASDAMERPFIWGQSDCSTAACDVFAALHGIDPMARVRGIYQSACGAMRLITVQGGWAAYSAALAADAGLVPVDQEAAGDIGLVETAGRHSLAICAGPGIWATKTENGLGIVTKAERAWRFV